MYLSDQCTAATTAAQHTAFASAAEAFIAPNNIPMAIGISRADDVIQPPIEELVRVDGRAASDRPR